MKFCLAGTCCRPEFKSLFMQSPYILESFWYFKPWQAELMRTRELFLIDSGAFSFMNGRSNADLNGYLDRYIRFINEYDVRYFFELDVDSVTGYERVKEFRRRLEKETGKRCIPVWHKSRGVKEYKRMCEEYDYIAIGGLVIKSIRPDEYSQMKRLISYARGRGVKVHGLGFSPRDVADYGFYSCDSTSWQAGSRFSTAVEFRDGRMVMHKAPEGKRRVHYKVMDAHNIAEWIKYQDYLKRF